MSDFTFELSMQSLNNFYQHTYHYEPAQRDETRRVEHTRFSTRRLRRMLERLQRKKNRGGMMI